MFTGFFFYSLFILSPHIPFPLYLAFSLLSFLSITLAGGVGRPLLAHWLPPLTSRYEEFGRFSDSTHFTLLPPLASLALSFSSALVSLAFLSPCSRFVSFSDFFLYTRMRNKLLRLDFPLQLLMILLSVPISDTNFAPSQHVRFIEVF